MVLALTWPTSVQSLALGPVWRWAVHCDTLLLEFQRRVMSQVASLQFAEPVRPEGAAKGFGIGGRGSGGGGGGGGGGVGVGDGVGGGVTETGVGSGPKHGSEWIGPQLIGSVGGGVGDTAVGEVAGGGVVGSGVV